MSFDIDPNIARLIGRQTVAVRRLIDIDGASSLRSGSESWRQELECFFIPGDTDQVMMSPRDEPRQRRCFVLGVGSAYSKGDAGQRAHLCYKCSCFHFPLLD